MIGFFKQDFLRKASIFFLAVYFFVLHSAHSVTEVLIKLPREHFLV